MAEKKSRLVLLDSHAIIHRAYHALPPMSTKEGVPTGAVYGFVATLLKALAQLKPTHMVAAFDVKGPTFRHDDFADYKAHREAPAEELAQQFDLVRQVLTAFDVPIISKPRYEADDVIGTICKLVGAEAEKVIVTGDVDALQLVDEQTTVGMLQRGVGDMVLYDEAAVREKFGFEPKLLVDYKGLRGDPSDNIPGVAGIGDKTARDLVSQYGSIEEIFAHFEELPKRAQTRLKDHQKEAEFSRKLATIHCDVPITFSFADTQFDTYDRQAVREMLMKFEFHSLLSRLPQSGQTPTQDRPEHYMLVQTPEAAAQLREALQAADIVAFDVENDSLGARQYPIVGMSFAVRIDGALQAWYVPVDRESVKEWQDVLESPSIKKTGHNLKYDYLVLRQSGIRLGGIVFDTMLASYLLDAGSRQHGLDYLAAVELKHDMIPISNLIGSGKEQKKMSEVDVESLAHYACEDADVALRLYEVLRERIEAQGQRRVLDEIEVPLLSVLAEMEEVGIALDRDELSIMSKEVERMIADLRERIWKLAREEFNINSPTQMRTILFEKLALPTVGIKRTKSGFSTAASELLKLRAAHEIVGLIEQYREVSKLQNTYITTLPKLVAEDGRIHTSFNQTIAATGRLSSTDPNLQNIPIRTELGARIRKAFVAEAGKRLIKADYSQMELRLAAHLSQDEKMLQVFREGGDIHAATAAWVYGVDAEAVTDQQRRQAKTLNFGVLYGMGASSFAQQAGISVEEARSFIGRYQDQYGQLMRYIEETVAFAREHGYTETIFGRRRKLPEINASNPAVRAGAERMAFNFPVQGAEADILKIAMVRLHEAFAQHLPEARLLLTVHDELVVEVPEDLVAEAANQMRTIMEGVITLDVPIEVEVAAGPNWQETVVQ